MDIKEILSKVHIDAGIDPDYRFASNKSELNTEKTMIALKNFSAKNSLEGEIAAKLCFYSSDNKDANGSFTIGTEILRDCYGKIDYFISDASNVEVFNSTASLLKAYKKNIHITAVCCGVLPDTVNLAVIDETVNISEADAKKYKEELFNTEHLSVGLLSGAALKAAKDIAEKICVRHTRIVVLFPDSEN